MFQSIRTRSTLAAVALITLFSGCLINGANSGTSGPFAASDLTGTWNQGCTAGTSGLVGQGATYYTNSIVFSGGSTFSATQAWYTAAGCAGGAYLIIYMVGGTYTVGGLVNGTQAIQFTVNTSSIMPMTNGIITYFNGHLSNYASFTTPGNAQSVYSAIASWVNLPNSGNKIVNNIASLNGSTLALGGPNEVIPGVFTSGTIPTTVGISLNKQ